MEIFKLTFLIHKKQKYAYYVVIISNIGVNVYSLEFKNDEYPNFIVRPIPSNGKSWKFVAAENRCLLRHPIENIQQILTKQCFITYCTWQNQNGLLPAPSSLFCNSVVLLVSSTEPAIKMVACHLVNVNSCIPSVHLRIIFLVTSIER